jgi:alkylation response protein AidB-like acyl-CoA dehydrogenase
MNFALSDEQRMLKDSARDFLARECSPAEVREAIESEAGFSEELWRKITALGWPALVVPERYGGQGGGAVDLAILLEEAGRALLPSPLFATTALGALPLAHAKGPVDLVSSLLGAVAAGTKRLTSALFEDEAGWDLEPIATAARGRGDRARLTGTKVFVPDAGAADAILVLAREESGEGAFFAVEPSAGGVALEPIPTLDWGRQWIVALDGAPGRRIDGLAPGRMRDLGAALLAAEMVGAAERAMEMAVEWAKTRVQFGRPIGAFQAVSHKCADMLLAVESARSLVHYACLALDEDRPDAAAAVSAAKAQASEIFPRVAEDALQVHGGMGYTWEHDAHLYLRRARATQARFGDAAWHEERILKELGW